MTYAEEVTGSVEEACRVGPVKLYFRSCQYPNVSYWPVIHALSILVPNQFQRGVVCGSLHRVTAKLKDALKKFYHLLELLCVLADLFVLIFRLGGADHKQLLDMYYDI